ncbi:hypothetical protein [robinz microvirus RP_178]|nr:hypothetical protein [robinz microvirus RP_178]
MEVKSSWRNLVGRLSRTRTPEVNSGIGFEIPTGKEPLTMQEMVKRYIREAVSAQAVNDGQESFSEANDFEEEDPDVVPLTHHQVVAMDDSELREEAGNLGYMLTDDDPPEAPQEIRPPSQSGLAAGSPGGQPKASPEGS